MVIYVPEAPVTPTVELNSMAMKYGLHTKYENIEPPRMPFYPPLMIGNHNLRDPFRPLSPYQ